MRLVQLTPDLLHLIQLRENDRLFVQWLTHPAMVSTACLPDRGWAMLDGGYVIGASGVFQYFPHRGSVWMLVSARATWRHFGHAARLMRPLIDRLQEPLDQGGGGFYRLEADTVADWQPGNNFLKALGFEREDRAGLRWYHCAGLTSALYGRIRPPATPPQPIELPASAFETAA